MSALLTEDEKARCRRHLGFPEVAAVSVYAMGMVIPMQGAFLLEAALSSQTQYSAERVRQLLGILDGFETKMLKAACYLTVESIGDIKMRGAQSGMTSTDLLRREYIYWAKRLSDTLGVPYYPYAEMFQGQGNIRVRR
jgi:hypothetical protein